MKALAAVGQMAFPLPHAKYSLHAILLRLRTGLLLNHLRFHQLYYVVGPSGSLQLIYSPLWLRYYFRFGPFEWLWRSLTYWKKQPMKL